MTAIGKDDRWHLEMKRRWVDQYNFYVQDSHWGRMFVRVCPYFPFSARVCLNQHYWLALRLQERGIRFRQRSEEHTSELQSRLHLVCRLLLEKKKTSSTV